MTLQFLLSMLHKFLIFYSLFKIELLFSQFYTISIPMKHTNYINKLIYSSDFNYIFTSSIDGSIFLWSDEGRFLRAYFPSHYECIDLKTNINNNFLFLAYKNGDIFKINIKTAKILNTININDTPTCLFYAKLPKNEFILVGQKNGLLNVIDTNFNIIKTINFENKYPIKIVPSKNPNQVFIGLSNSEIIKYQSSKIKSNIVLVDLQNFMLYPISPYSYNLIDLAISSDSTILISASEEKQTVIIFDGLKHIEINTIKTKFKPNVVFISNNNKLIGIGSGENGEVVIHRHTGETILEYQMETEKIIFGEFNKNLTRIHLCSKEGIFNYYDFNGHLRKEVGKFVNLANNIIYLKFLKDFLMFSTHNKNFYFFHFSNKILKNFSDFIPSNILKIISYNDQLILLLEPHSLTSSNNNFFSNYFETKIVFFKNEKIIKTLEYKNSFISDIEIFNNYLLISFNQDSVLALNLKNLSSKKLLNIPNMEILKIIIQNNLLYVLHLPKNNYTVNYYINIYEINHNNLQLKLIKKLEFNEEIFNITKNGDIISYSSIFNTKSNKKIKFNQWIYDFIQNNDTFYLFSVNKIYKCLYSSDFPELKIIDSSYYYFRNNFKTFNTNKHIIIAKNSAFFDIISKNSLKKIGFLYIEGNNWIINLDNNFDCSDELKKEILFISGIGWKKDIELAKSKIKPTLLMDIFSN